MKLKKRIFSLRALIFAVLLTASVSSVTLSRYMTTITGTATGDIAAFEVTLQPAAEAISKLEFNGSATEDNTEQKSYAFTVTSESDVNLHYTLAVDFDGKQLPDGVTLWIDETSNPLTWREDTDKGTGRYESASGKSYSYAMSDKQPKEHVLHIQVEYGSGADVKVFDTANLGAMTISVTAMQD